MSPESRQFLAYLAAQPKGRVGYDIRERDRVMALASEAVAAGHAQHRRFYFGSGFQITPAGRAYLAGEGL
jgi:hypothetical protein